MANQRVFDEVEALTVNSTNVGGINSVSVEQSYMDNIQADGGGAGPDAYDEAGEKVTVSIASTDVLQLIPLLISTPATCLFYGHESGATTYTKATVGTAKSKLVCHTGRLGVTRTGHAAMNIDGTIRSDDAETFEDICTYLDGQSAPTLHYPGRIWKPTALAHGSITVLHPVSLNVRITPRLLQRYGDTDVGLTALDVAGHDVSVDLTVHDSGVQGVTAYEVMTELIKQGTKDLTVDLEGVGATADQVLTLRNCRWRRRGKSTQRGDTSHSLSGVLQWIDPESPYTARTLDHETPATRLINIAAA